MHPLRLLCRATVLAAILASSLAACGLGGKKEPPPPLGETFGAEDTYSRVYPAAPDAACEATRRALLGQGYVIGNASAETLEATKSFQPESDVHTQLNVRATCVSRTGGGSIVFVNAVQDLYSLKTTTKTASVGLSVLGSVSLPIGSSGANLVRVASNTVQNTGFYNRFFERVQFYLPGTEGVDQAPPPPESETPPDPVSFRPTAAAELLITGARVYPAPGVAPIENASVLVRDGRIVSVGPAGDVDAGEDAEVVDASGGTLLAGFWNSHVHFTEPKWAGAATLPASRLQSQLREMLVRYGFTTVVDTGSDPRDTGPLRARIESGEVAGPRIVMAMSPLYPPDGVPYYVRNALPPEVLPLLSEPATAELATATVRANLEGEGDVVKLFTASWVEEGGAARPMPLPIASAAVQEAHRHGALVFSHPSDVAGLEVALASGVDVLAHSVEDLDGFDRSHLQRMQARNMAMVPTLQLFSVNPAPKLDAIVQEVGDYQRLGGSLWFGTDVGFIEEYDPALEFELLQRAGLSFDQILASLTTSPAGRLPGGEGRGRVEAGMIADLVVLEDDPARAPDAWTRVRYVFRDGRKIFDAAP